MSIEAYVISSLVEEQSLKKGVCSMTRKEKLIYAAGLFDGEGCVKVYSAQPTSSRALQYGSELAVGMNDHRCIEFLMELFGGTCIFYPSSSGNRQSRWRIAGPSSSRMAEAILPYTISKRTQLELFLEYRKLLTPGRAGYGRGLTRREIIARDRLISKIKKAKREEVVYVG